MSSGNGAVGKRSVPVWAALLTLLSACQDPTQITLENLLHFYFHQNTQCNKEQHKTPFTSLQAKVF